MGLFKFYHPSKGISSSQLCSKAYPAYGWILFVLTASPKAYSGGGDVDIANVKRQGVDVQHPMSQTELQTEAAERILTK